MDDDREATLRDRLRSGLREAMLDRDSTVVNAIRTALAAIDNAEAVAIGSTTARSAAGRSAAGRSAVGRSATDESPIAGSAGGLGEAEVTRRRLGESEIVELVRTEIAERLSAAQDYDAAGVVDRAREQRRAAEVLARHLEG